MGGDNVFFSLLLRGLHKDIMINIQGTPFVTICYIIKCERVRERWKVMQRNAVRNIFRNGPSHISLFIWISDIGAIKQIMFYILLVFVGGIFI